MNYHNRRFRSISASPNSEVSNEVIFCYQQTGNVLSCTYDGGSIVTGHLLGTVDKAGVIQMNYHQISKDGRLMSGVCQSTPEVGSNGKIRLHEKWHWTSGDRSKGESILEEI